MNTVKALIVGVLFLLNLLPLLAPILECLGEKNFSSFIYWVYQFFCHQKASRSIFICDHQYGWCARCTFLWISMLVSSGLVFYYKPLANFKGLGILTTVVLCLPLALDGGLQLIASYLALFTGSEPFYVSSNSIRAITGILFGLGLGFFLFPQFSRLSNDV